MLGLVAAGHPETAEAAAFVLGEGGNAFDAVVAAGFASAVAEPMLTSLGGGGFCLARPADGEAVLFDFFVDTPGRGAPPAAREPHFVPVTVRFPSADQVFHVGLGSVAVPGVLAGLLHVHRRLGSRPLAEVVRPAATLARRGVEVTPFQSYTLGLLLPIVSLSEASGRLYAPGGRPVAPGGRLRNPELADFLEALPRDGGRRFYQGDLARRIAADMRAEGGLLTEEDLAAYAEQGVVERTPLAVDYRGHRLLGNPPPSRGASLVAYGLEELARRDPARHARGGPAHLEALAEVLEAMEAHRAAPTARATSRGTTHVSVADARGHVASMTTSNGEGSGYVAPGTGIQLNNMLGEDDL
ncbi:MAG: gamma-glutamyltransferase, partial [Myxococcota bacterium]|nr:gamma-glutamyltransferase [Myxococcota bacterium]